MSDEFDRDEDTLQQNGGSGSQIQPQPQLVPEEETKGFIESTYYINGLYKELISHEEELTKGLDTQSLIDILITRSTSCDEDKQKEVSVLIQNIQSFNNGVLKSFVTQHDEALKEYYKDVTGKELDKEEALSADVIKAYSKLEKDEGNLKQHAEAIRYFGDGSADYFMQPLDYIFEAMGTFGPYASVAKEAFGLDAPFYQTLSKWADWLTIDKFYHDAASAIRSSWNTSTLSLRMKVFLMKEGYFSYRHDNLESTNTDTKI